MFKVFPSASVLFVLIGLECLRTLPAGSVEAEGSFSLPRLQTDLHTSERRRKALAVVRGQTVGLIIGTSADDSGGLPSSNSPSDSGTN